MSIDNKWPLSVGKVGRTRLDVAAWMLSAAIDQLGIIVESVLLPNFVDRLLWLDENSGERIE